MEHRFNGNPIAEVRQRIERPVLVVLDGHGGELLRRCAVAFHVRARDHRIQSGERDAVERLVLLVRSGGKRSRRRVAVDVGHLLHTGREDDVAHPARHLDEGGSHRQSAGGAGRFHPRRRYRSHAEAVGEKTGEVFLLDEESARHAADIHRVHVIRAGVLDRSERGLQEQVAERFRPQLAEAMHPDADNGHLSHERSVLLACDFLPEPGVLGIIELHGRP